MMTSCVTTSCCCWELSCVHTWGGSIDGCGGRRGGGDGGIASFSLLHAADLPGHVQQLSKGCQRERDRAHVVGIKGEIGRADRDTPFHTGPNPDGTALAEIRFRPDAHQQQGPTVQGMPWIDDGNRLLPGRFPTHRGSMFGAFRATEGPGYELEREGNSERLRCLTITRHVPHNVGARSPSPPLLHSGQDVR